MSARYDGFAAWYDENIARYTAAAGGVVERLLGTGTGRCLDLCCGTGVHLQALLALGWQVTGADSSADQLRIARERVGDDVELVQGDAEPCPPPTGTSTRSSPCSPTRMSTTSRPLRARAREC